MLIIILFAVIYLVNHRVTFDVDFVSKRHKTNMSCQNFWMLPRRKYTLLTSKSIWCSKTWYHMQIISFIIADGQLKLLNKRPSTRLILFWSNHNYLFSLTNWWNTIPAFRMCAIFLLKLIALALPFDCKLLHHYQFMQVVTAHFISLNALTKIGC